MSIWQKLTDLTDLASINNEMSKRYKDTILTIVNNDTGKSYNVIYVCFDNETMKYVFSDEHGNRITLATDTNWTVKVPKLQPGYYNASKGVVYIKYQAARQWKRGLCHSNLSVTYPENYWNEMPGIMNKHNKTIMEALNDQKNISFTQAIDTLSDQENQVVSIAVSNGISLQAHHITDDPNVVALWYHTIHFGDVCIKQREIMVRVPEFTQEVLEELHNLRVTNYGFV